MELPTEAVARLMIVQSGNDGKTSLYNRIHLLGGMPALHQYRVVRIILVASFCVSRKGLNKGINLDKA